MNNVHIKKQIEEKFGIPYEEFCELDPEIITGLIETKIDKKLKLDYRQFIDGIPIDKAYTITKEEIDKSAYNGFQRVMRKIFKRI